MGQRADGRREILSGVKPGDRVVTSGNFLIDSESRLQSGLQAMEAMPGHAHGAAPAKPTAPAKPAAPAGEHAGQGGMPGMPGM